MLRESQLIVAPGTDQAAYLARLVAVINHQRCNSFMAAPPAFTYPPMTASAAPILCSQERAVNTLVLAATQAMLGVKIILHESTSRGKTN